MKKVLLPLIIIVAIKTSVVFAGPFWFGYHQYTQPDGTTFSASKSGDEFGIYTMTEYGAIQQGEDEYWYYVKYDKSGNCWTTNLRVGIDEKNNSTTLDQLKKQNAENYTVYTKSIRNIHRTGTYKIAKTQNITFPSSPESLFVLCVQFSDCPGDTATTKSTIENFLFEADYADYPGDICGGSLRDYYYDMSHGLFDLKGRVLNKTSNDTIQWVNMPYTKEYYSHQDINYNDFMSEALTAAYNQDSLLVDTTLDNGKYKVAIIYAGEIVYCIPKNDPDDPDTTSTLCSQARPDSGIYLIFREKRLQPMVYFRSTCP